MSSFSRTPHATSGGSKCVLVQSRLRRRFEPQPVVTGSSKQPSGHSDPSVGHSTGAPPSSPALPASPFPDMPPRLLPPPPESAPPSPARAAPEPPVAASRPTRLELPRQAPSKSAVV